MRQDGRDQQIAKLPCRNGILATAAAAALLAAGCSSDDDSPASPTQPIADTPTTIKVRIDNIGKTYPIVESNAFLSLAIMFVPSNDLFSAPMAGRSGPAFKRRLLLYQDYLKHDMCRPGKR